MTFDFTMHPVAISFDRPAADRSLARGRKILAAYRQVPPGERHGLADRFGYASVRSMDVMACRYRKRLGHSLSGGRS